VRPASRRRKARAAAQRGAEGKARKAESTQAVAATVAEAESAVAGAEGTRINWDVSNLRSVYANVCSVSSTREEVVMLFGLNQTWNRLEQVVSVRLSDRIVFSPTGGKRLALTLQAVISEYERRWGPLNT
jgi:hypothetical protein